MTRGSTADRWAPTRRQLLRQAVAGATALALARCAPRSSEPQPRRSSRPARIGWLGTGPPPPDSAPNTSALFRGLEELGYVAERDFSFEPRWVSPAEDTYTQLAAELV